MAELYHTIYVPKDLTPDLLIGIFLLKEFGDHRYPGIHQARVEISDQLPTGKDGTSLESEGSISFGFTDALFPRISTISHTQQMINALNIPDTNPVHALKNIAEKNQQPESYDFYTILDGLISEYIEKPNKAFKSALPIITAHYHALQEALDPIATEYMEKLNNGDVIALIIQKNTSDIRVILIESQHPEMAAFLHNQEEIRADLVVQQFASGHVNITTRYRSRIDLEEVVQVLRIEEARKKKLPFDSINWNDLRNPDRMEGIEEWKYDVENNGIFNTKALGKPNHGATSLALKELKTIIQIGLDTKVFDRKCPPVGCRGKKCKFYFFNLERCKNRRINKDIDQKKVNLKQNVQILRDESIVKLDE